MSKIICPFCLGRFAVKRAKRITNKQKNDLFSNWNHKASNSNAGEVVNRFCPFCEAFLPESYLHSTPFLISLVGVPLSGKSHWLAMVVRGLLNQRSNSNLLGLTNVTLSYLSQSYYGFINSHLFRDQIPLPATQVNQPNCIILEINTPNYSNNISLVFYDTAGNDILKQTLPPYITQADALIWMLPPWTLPGLSENLPALVKNHFKSDSISSENYMQHLINGLTNGKKKKKISQISQPLAISLSQLDLLDYIQEQKTFQNLLTLRQPNLIGPSFGQLQKVERLVKGTIEKFGTMEFNTEISHFLRVGYQAFSATGSLPLDLEDRFFTFRSVGYIDPLIWVLQQLGIR